MKTLEQVQEDKNKVLQEISNLDKYRQQLMVRAIELQGQEKLLEEIKEPEVVTGTLNGTNFK